ncbi:MAG: hypothetical protein H6Q90_319 [Deltaproteobacteria bacterium]|nr:hypothetical protein [Deltaproteobacteria bacterium]
MASIRIVDSWLRSPASAPSHHRSVMVIAEKWAEQRVLMRAYSDSRDQTQPTIVLHAQELAIGPAGLDINGSWGIHVAPSVGENDGRAQEIKEQLEAAARRLSGSKGNPPRLFDEEATFDRASTANWGPGAPRVLAKRPEAQAQVPQVDFVAPIGAARVPSHQAATYVPQLQSAHHVPSATPVPPNAELRKTPRPRSRTTRHPAIQPHHHAGSRTALGYTSGSGAQSAVVRLGLSPQVSARLGRLVDRVVPVDFHIDPGERRVLNALGDGELTARTIGQMLDLNDAVAYMESLTRKLESYHLDLVEPGEPHGNEPTYRLRR